MASQSPGGVRLRCRWATERLSPDGPSARDRRSRGEPAVVSREDPGGSTIALDRDTLGCGAPQQDLWLLIVSGEAGGIEGSWGTDAFGAQRNGDTPSGQCGTTARDNSSACP